MLPRLPIDIACLPPSLEVLHLAENRISNWESMDVLAEKTPKLVTLTVRGNGFVDGESFFHCIRPQLVRP